MPLDIQRVNTNNQKLKALLYGPPGAGKTHLAVTANDHPEMSPALVLNLEGGLLSVASRGDVDAVEIRTSGQMDEVIQELYMQTPSVQKYKTVIIDSGSELSNRALQEWVQRNSARATRRGKGDADRTQDDVQREDYGKMGNQLVRLFGWYRDLPMHVICTSLDKTIYPENADKRIVQPSEIRPAFTDKLGTSVMGMFDHVWYLYPDANELSTRHMVMQSMGPVRAKCRGINFNAEVAAVGGWITNPSMPMLFDWLRRCEQPGYVPQIAQDGENVENAAT